MAEWKPNDSYQGPKEDPIAKGIWDAPPGTRPLRGYLTRNKDDSTRWRLFTDITLTAYYDLSDKDIRYSHQFDDDLRGSIIYVDRELDLRRTTTGTIEDFLTSLSEGSIADGDKERVTLGSFQTDPCKPSQISKIGFPNCC